MNGLGQSLKRRGRFGVHVTLSSPSPNSQPARPRHLPHHCDILYWDHWWTWRCDLAALDKAVEAIHLLCPQTVIGFSHIRSLCGKVGQVRKEGYLVHYSYSRFSSLVRRTREPAWEVGGEEESRPSSLDSLFKKKRESRERDVLLIWHWTKGEISLLQGNLTI